MREEALRDRLLAYRALGKYELAGPTAEKLLAQNPTRPDLFRIVGDYYEDQKRYNRAEPVWQRLAQLLDTGRPTGIGAGNPESHSYFTR